MLPTSRIALCAAAACVILAFAALPRPDARAAPRRQGGGWLFLCGYEDELIDFAKISLSN
jgi:hypothetical protein